MTMFADTPEIREVIRQWAIEHATRTTAAAQAVLASAEFQEWAKQEMQRRFPDMTMDRCARHWVDELDMVKVPWPAVATPSWATRVEIGHDLGGEVDVSLELELESADPAVGATIELLLSVVVDVDPERTRNEGQAVGDWRAGVPGFAVWGMERHDALDWRKTEAMADVLARAAKVIRELTVSEVVA